MSECSGAGGSDREEKITLHPLALPWIVSVCERIPNKKNPCRNIQQWRKCALLYKSKFETNKIAADQKQGSEAYLETRKKSKMELCAEIVLQKFNANILSIFSFFLLFCRGGGGESGDVNVIFSYTEWYNDRSILYNITVQYSWKIIFSITINCCENTASHLNESFYLTIIEDKNISGSWNLVLNSSIRSYFDTQDFNVWALLL